MTSVVSRLRNKTIGYLACNIYWYIFGAPSVGRIGFTWTLINVGQAITIVANCSNKSSNWFIVWTIITKPNCAVYSSSGDSTPICLRISSWMRANCRLSLSLTLTLSVWPARTHLRTSSASYRKPQLFCKLNSHLAVGNGQVFSDPSTSVIVVGHQNEGTCTFNPQFEKKRRCLR